MRRQAAVLAAALLAVFAVTAAFFYANRPAPSCHDNRQNQGEDAPDCGGPCVSCAFRDEKPLQVFWARFVKVRQNTYDVAAEIRNPNARLGAPVFDYTFKLFDAAGVAVAERSGRSFIYPGETAHVIEVGLTSGRTVREATLTIRDPDWVLAETIAPDVIAGGKEYLLAGEGGEQTSLVRAIITNRTVQNLTEILVGATVFDERGNLLGVHRTLIDELPPDGAKAVTFSWPAVFPAAPSSLLVEPRSRSLLPGLEP